MHTIYLKIDDNLDEQGLQNLQADLRSMGHVTDVEVDAGTPHNLLVEFEEEHLSPVAILRQLDRHGYHADIMSG